MQWLILGDEGDVAKVDMVAGSAEPITPPGDKSRSIAEHLDEGPWRTEQPLARLRPIGIVYLNIEA
ncbi:hypothetical protein [Sphingobium baderi]|uniref:Uncharacterized protein n=1 Tax=Sphingobium baderi TaxID=1332080 RepID=A0A0S3EYR2_9SPHN|nr:hypothetical protein [Sphingobium baderi]ALR20558.1 hypothetical protein ATN00_09825 [Sphingobium baderi]